MKKWLACSLVVAMSGCPDVKKDPGEGPGEIANGPTVEFDPANAIIPFPNNLVMNPATGKLNIPAPACETATAKAVREGVLNQLDGFGTYEAGMQVTFTDDIDMSTVTSDTVKMFERSKDGMDLATPKPIDVVIQLNTALHFSAADCSSPKVVNAITIVPTMPLDPHATYTVALLSGIKTLSNGGALYQPSFTWALIRQPTDPVKLADGCDYAQPDSCTIVSEQTPLTPGGDANGNGVPDQTEIVGLDQLWHAEAKALALIDPLVGNDRSKVLVAWEVTTQTTTSPLDPMVSGSPASKLGNTPLLGIQSIVCNKDPQTCPNGYDHSAVPFNECTGADSAAQCFLEIALGAGACGAGCTPQQIYQTGKTVCDQVGCAAVGDILAGGLAADDYQVPGANPLAGGAMVPGAWSDPVHPTVQGGGIIQVLAFVPVTAPPTGGYPTVIFGHGLGRSKSDLFAIGPQLTVNHYAAVAIDFVASGSRAIQTSNDASIGCGGTPSATSAPQCFQPILSTNLGQTRDNIRQTVLDLERLSNAIAACDATTCTSANSSANLHVDPTKIEYIGQSLGGIIGTVFTSVSSRVKASVLNVAAMGWLDVLEHTDNLTIRCSLVNGLIDAGVVQGDKYNPTSGTGLCTTDAWKMQPGYVQFSGIARIVLDPADPANFLGLLSQRRFLEQEVVGDQVVPNFATERGFMYTGLTPQDADPYIPSVDTTPSAPLTAMPMANHWLQYKPVAANGQFPGNTFQHGSLLAPAAGAAGQLGTARMQTDAIYFLLMNQ